MSNMLMLICSKTECVPVDHSTSDQLTLILCFCFSLLSFFPSNYKTEVKLFYLLLLLLCIYFVSFFVSTIFLWKFLIELIFPLF